MKYQISLTLSPEESANDNQISLIACKKLQIQREQITYIKKIKRSIDARQKNIKIIFLLEIGVGEKLTDIEDIKSRYSDVSNKKKVLIIGSGPAGLFAALRLIEGGIRPIIIERGKEVHERKRDIAILNKEKIINPESNYCFGEGGAGTFSDGKLYTRSNKRGNINKILNIFHSHGAIDDILIDSHPHIGTDKLPQIIANIRKTILDAGGDIYFNTRLIDLKIKDSKITEIITQTGKNFETNVVILATGHSAKDIYYLLNQKNILIEPKGFAMGLRIEHPQNIIDSIQYHSKGERNPYLPAASYSLSQQIDGRGVYSFCMCPGGYIVTASTDKEELVVNGMSPYKRNSGFANSGMVVEIKTEDLQQFNKNGIFAGLELQSEIEKSAFVNGGSTQSAPAQRMVDFVNKKVSSSLPPNSYLPGLVSSPLHFWLPEFISDKLIKAFNNFGKSLKGFLTNEAIIVGVESRTSSPIRIPRNPNTFQHTQIEGLFPCGEGSGYAGGIISSALDGEKAAEKVIEFLN